ncbi:hypothetical protein PIB30_086940, partial [Stylosanthes scabra]|nr:hypothetical protein [Stylosanthes scabra]
MERKHAKVEISQRSKNEKRRKGTVVIGLEQTQTLSKDEFNIYNFHAKFGAEVAKKSTRNEKITKKSLKAKSKAYAYALPCLGRHVLAGTGPYAYTPEGSMQVVCTLKIEKNSDNKCGFDSGFGMTIDIDSVSTTKSKGLDFPMYETKSFSLFFYSLVDLKWTPPAIGVVKINCDASKMQDITDTG